MISCLYVFQKRCGHSDFQNYTGPFSDYIISNKIISATDIFVLDIAVVPPEDANAAEEAVYTALVVRFGAEVVPQIPVNGTKVIDLTEEQKQMLSSFSSDHPCRPLLSSPIGTSIFAKQIKS